MTAVLGSLNIAHAAAGERREIGPSEVMIGFSITPTPAGSWLWRAFDHEGQRQAQGLAATRKQAAALVIRHILLSQAPQTASGADQPSARAA